MRGYLITDTLYNEFKEVCELYGAIPSKIIRKTIKEYITNNKKKNN
jgi:ribosomal protein S17E